MKNRKTRFAALACLTLIGGSLMTMAAPEALALTVLKDREPGSALVFPLFDVNNDAGNSRATTIKITNLSDTEKVTVHLLRVCAGIKSFAGEGLCQGSNRTATLTPKETFIRDVASYFSVDRDNCPTGYILAYVQRGVGDTQPIVKNVLIGSVHMNSAGALNQRTAGMQAYGVQAFGMDGDAVENSEGGFFPVLPFNGFDYAAPANRYSTDFLATSGNRWSELTLLNLDIQIGAQNPPTLVAIQAHNQKEVPFSASLEFVCHVNVRMDDEINAAQPGAGVQGGNAFKAGPFGTAYGSLEIEPYPGTGAILGAITEKGQNRMTLRGLWHSAEPYADLF